MFSPCHRSAWHYETVISAIETEHRQRRFLWSLSFGILILAASGWMFCGWGISALQNQTAAWLAFWADLIVASALVWAGVSVRRKAAGFSYRDLRLGSPEQRRLNKRRNIVFQGIVAAEWSLVGLAAFLAYHFGRGDLFPPILTLIVSLHFFPLAKLLGFPVYYTTAAVGTVLSMAGLLSPLTPEAHLIFVSGFGVTLFFTAIYAFLNADRLARSWAAANPA
jgi:hypothetical protein